MPVHPTPACRIIDCSWDRLQFVCICLCRCLHWTFLLCLTRIERMRGNNSDYLGAPTANKYLVITIKCGLGSFLWGSALSFGFRTHPMRTHQSALTSSSIRNECWVSILAVWVLELLGKLGRSQHFGSSSGFLLFLVLVSKISLVFPRLRYDLIVCGSGPL